MSVAQTTVELVFLMDDLPIADQVQIQPKFKIQVAMKYAYTDVRRDIKDDKIVAMLFGEMCNRLKYSSTNASNVTNEQVATLLGIQLHCRNVINPGSTGVEYAREMLPKWMESTVAPEFFDTVQAQTRSLGNTSFTDAAKKLLVQVRSQFPHWFATNFDALHLDQSAMLTLSATTEGLYVGAADKPQIQALYMSYKTLSRWNFNAEDDLTMSLNSSSVVRNSQAKHGRGSMLSSISDDAATQGSLESVATGANMNKSVTSTKLSVEDQSLAAGSKSGTNIVMAPQSEPNAASKKNSAGGMKGTLGRFSLGRKNQPPRPSVLEQVQVAVKEKQYRYSLTLSFNQDYLYPVELIVLSHLPNDMRLKEVIDHYSGKASKVIDVDADDETEILDDPLKVNGPVTCVSNQDYEAKADEELMFLAGETIQVLKKLDNGFYVGSCQNIEGIFRGSMVTFQRRDKDVAMQAKRRNMLLMQISKPKVVEQRVDVVNLYFLDETRKSFKITDKTLGGQLIRMMAEKLELSDCDFFGIALQVEGGERWLKHSIPVTSQLVPDCKMYFKIRSWYYDSSDLEDRSMANLFYLQVKQFVLSGFDPIEENEVVEFGSLQLQAFYGDHDPEKHKVNTIGNVTSYLPPTY